MNLVIIQNCNAKKLHHVQKTYSSPIPSVFDVLYGLLLHIVETTHSQGHETVCQVQAKRSHEAWHSYKNFLEMIHSSNTPSTLGSLRFRTCPSKIGCPRIHYYLIGIRTTSIKHETNAEGTMRSYWISAIWNKQLHNKFLPFT